ncbi:MAG: hypothetical protein P1U82_30200 [Verrucomicrobiales bacterium]|nr:hypothetical protein [Verrucomicrobiales bacterium]
MPLVPITLTNAGNQHTENGLVDSGSAINVLPFSLGIRIGLEWDSQLIRVPLSGALSGVEARAVRLAGRIGEYQPVALVFAWSSEDVRLILGHSNFLEQFNFVLRRKELYFELSPS